MFGSSSLYCGTPYRLTRWCNPNVDLAYFLSSFLTNFASLLKSKQIFPNDSIVYPPMVFEGNFETFHQVIIFSFVTFFYFICIFFSILLVNFERFKSKSNQIFGNDSIVYPPLVFGGNMPLDLEGNIPTVQWICMERSWKLSFSGTEKTNLLRGKVTLLLPILRFDVMPCFDIMSVSLFILDFFQDSVSLGLTALLICRESVMRT